MKKNKTIVIATLTVIGAISVVKTVKGVKTKLIHEKKQLELESLLHTNFRGKKDVRGFVKSLDDDEVNALLKVLHHFDIG